MSKSNSTVTDQPINASNASVIAIATTFVGVTLVEGIIRTCLQLSHFGHLKIFILNSAGWALFPVGFVAAYSARSLKWRALPLLCGILVLVYVAVTEFRGMWVWPGTLDVYWDPQSFWVVPLSLGLLGSFAVLVLFPSEKKVSNSIAIAGMILFGLATLVELGGGYLFSQQIGSVYPPTRWLLMMSLLVVLTVCLITDRKEN